jgi:hypothetical protein
MNHDAAALDQGAVSEQVAGVIGASLVVVNDHFAGCVPDLDPEPIHTSANVAAIPEKTQLVLMIWLFFVRPV